MNNKIVELIKELATLKEERERLVEESKAKYVRIEEISRIDLPELMNDEGVSTITVDEIGRVSLRGELFASIIEANKNEAFEWLRSTGKESLITETVNASTFKAAAKQWLISGEPIPECMVITPFTSAILTRSKGGKKE